MITASDTRVPEHLQRLSELAVPTWRYCEESPKSPQFFDTLAGSQATSQSAQEKR